MPTADQQEPDTLAAVARFNDAFNRHDLDAVMETMTADTIFDKPSPAPDGTRIAGSADVRAYWQEFFTNNPDAQFEIEEIFAAGNRCIVRWVFRRARDGRPWHLRGVDIFEVRHGKIAAKLAYVKG